MSTDAYGEQLPVPGRRGPAFGHEGPLPEVEAERETDGPLDGRTEAILAFAIVMSILAAYGAIGYGLYALGMSVL